MRRLLAIAVLTCLPITNGIIANAQNRPAFPTRDPHTPGYVAAKELPDGTNAPANADGNFILGPTHPQAPEMTATEIKGSVIEFTMSSTDSKFYPGIARDPNTFGTPDPANPASLIVTTSHPAPLHPPRLRLCAQTIHPKHSSTLHRRRGWPRPYALHRARRSHR